MLSKENLEEFTRKKQTDIQNIVREYIQHLFLSYLYQIPNSERLLFKGGTALRIILKNPRFSEDLDFTGLHITQKMVEELFTVTLANIEKSGIEVELEEGKNTTGGYLGIATFTTYDNKIQIRIEVSLRDGKKYKGTRAVVANDYIPTYTLVHLPTEYLIEGKIQALLSRYKPRDFYDYFFLLNNDYPEARNTLILQKILRLLKDKKINFQSELKKLLPASHAMLLKDFSKILENKISNYLKK
jgi:predicted nucleotidyltransferase component of viral defense system